MNEIEAYLSPYPEEIRAVAHDLSEIIRSAVPGVSEKLVPGWQLIGYRTPKTAGNRYFCFVAPYEDRVRLGFEWGVLLADEERLLQDEGTQIRSIYFDETAVINAALLTDYIQEAAAVALLSKEAKASLAMQREAEREM